MHTHTMKLSPAPFEKIVAGGKVIESRLYDEKRRAVAVGDLLVFHNAGIPEQTITVRVTELLRAPSFSELFQAHDPALFGGESREALLEEIHRYYVPEDERRHGVIGIRFEHI